jgi:four helix bundle protein
MERKYTGGFRTLIAWQEAKKLTLKIYAVTKSFPPAEQFGLTSQLRRAAASIMANVAEGSAMPTSAHRSNYYARARGSAVEVDNFIELAFELTLLDKNAFADLSEHIARVIHLVTKLMKS